MRQRPGFVPGDDDDRERRPVRRDRVQLAFIGFAAARASLTRPEVIGIS
jgi:hypothetical protein